MNGWDAQSITVLIVGVIGTVAFWAAFAYSLSRDDTRKK